MVRLDGDELLGISDGLLELAAGFVLVDQAQQRLQGHQAILLTFHGSPFYKPFGVLHLDCFQEVTAVELEGNFWFLEDGLLESGRIQPDVIRWI